MKNRLIAFELIILLLVLICQISCAATISATYVENEAFMNDSSLTAVEFSEGVESIGSRAFANCGSLDIVFPKSIKYIADDAFENTWPASLNVQEGSAAYQWCEAHGFLDQSVSDFTVLAYTQEKIVMCWDGIDYDCGPNNAWREIYQVYLLSDGNWANITNQCFWNDESNEIEYDHSFVDHSRVTFGVTKVDNGKIISKRSFVFNYILYDQKPIENLKAQMDDEMLYVTWDPDNMAYRYSISIYEVSNDGKKSLIFSTGRAEPYCSISKEDLWTGIDIDSLLVCVEQWYKEPGVDWPVFINEGASTKVSSVYQ